jgi:hypothetical protein
MNVVTLAVVEVLRLSGARGTAHDDLYRWQTTSSRRGFPQISVHRGRHRAGRRNHPLMTRTSFLEGRLLRDDL